MLALALLSRAATGQEEDARSRPGFLDSVEVNEVNVDVLVTDRRGNRVIDLTRDDFEVFEDGRRVEITAFRGPRPPVLEPAASESSARPSPPASASDPPANLLLFVDVTSLRPRHRRELIRALRESLSTEPESVRLMLVTYDGRLRVRHGFGTPTGDVLASLAAIERGRTTSPAEDRARTEELAAAAAELAAAVTPQQIESARSRRDSILSEIQAAAEGERLEILRTLDILRQLALSLGGLEGRKSVLYAGDELTMVPAADVYAAAGSAFTPQGGPGRPSALAARQLDLYRDFQALVRQANASGVSFNTLTPASRQHLGEVTQGIVGPPGFESSIRSEREDRIKEAACLMSHTTGGRCQSGGTDVSQLIDGTLEDLGAFYSLGYVPDREPDGEFHRLEVRVKRRRLQARHREGYVDRTAGDRLRERLAASLWLDAEVDELGVELAVEEERPSGRKGRFLVPIRITVPTDGFALLPSADGAHLAASSRILVLAATAAGRVIASEEIPWSFEVDSARLAAGAEPFTHRLELDLEQGSPKVAIGIWDEIGRRGSFVGRSVPVGAADAGTP